MVGWKNPLMPFTTQSLLAALPAEIGIRRYWLAFSGGLDSLVLLHAMAALRERLDGVELRAVHVDHGLSPNAGRWSAQCAEQCAVLCVPFELHRVNAKAQAGESPEAAARNARYEVLAMLVEEGDCLLTAHHQDDQAETLLLQLLRGAGPKGLAAMPPLVKFAQGWHARPLLNFRREDLRDYADTNGLHWVEDESNFDTGYDRNFLRHEIFPRLKERFPGAAATISRSARLCAEAAEVLAESAQRDLVAVRIDARSLSVSRLRALGEARAARVLHEWINQQDLPTPTAAQTAAVWREVICAAEDATPLVRWEGGEARRYRDGLFAQAPLPALDSCREFFWDLRTDLEIPGLGTLSATTTQGDGLDASRLEGQTVRVAFRQGGESLRPKGRKETHSLKHLLQEAGVPPWRRERIPLLWHDDELIAVVGFWVSEEYSARPDAPGMKVEFREQR